MLGGGGDGWCLVRGALWLAGWLARAGCALAPHGALPARVVGACVLWWPAVVRAAWGAAVSLLLSRISYHATTLEEIEAKQPASIYYALLLATVVGRIMQYY